MGSALQVTASQTKIVPSAHVHAVLAVTGLHFLNTHWLTATTSAATSQPWQAGHQDANAPHCTTQHWRSFNRRDVNCVQSHKKRITCQIKPEPLVTSALFSLNHIFSLSSDTNTHTRTVWTAYAVISLCIQTACPEFVWWCRFGSFWPSVSPSCLLWHINMTL